MWTANECKPGFKLLLDCTVNFSFLKRARSPEDRSTVLLTAKKDGLERLLVMLIGAFRRPHALRSKKTEAVY